MLCPPGALPAAPADCGGSAGGLWGARTYGGIDVIHTGMLLGWQSGQGSVGTALSSGGVEGQTGVGEDSQTIASMLLISDFLWLPMAAPPRCRAFPHDRGLGLLWGSRTSGCVAAWPLLARAEGLWGCQLLALCCE